jgi:hypothetical protein
MPDQKPTKLKIYNKKPGQISSGSNTAIEVDGKLLPHVTFIKIELKPNKLAKVTMELLLDMESVDLEVESSTLKCLRS